MIQLPGGYAITANDLSYVVGKTAVRKKTGAVVLNNQTYHRTIASAVQNVMERILRDKVADATITDLRGIAEEIERLYRETDTLLSQLEYGAESRESM